MRLWLASRSPRRRQLLTEAGLDHVAEHPGIEDSDLAAPAGAKPERWVASLAYLKACAGAAMARDKGMSEPVLVLGADTACVQNGALIGTPRDGSEAAAMLRGFRGALHEVVTGVAIIGLKTLPTGAPAIRTLFASRATVRFGDLSDRAILDYVDGGLWQGKAGAYNLKERLEAGWPIECEGDPHAVMGLPVAALVRRLETIKGLIGVGQ